MTRQVRNSAMIRLLETDFRRLDSAPFAWADGIGMLHAIPGVVGIWPGSGPTGVGDLNDLSGNALTLTARNTPTFGRDTNLLAPYLALASASSQYFDRADEVITSILGTEAHISAGVRGLSMGGWFRSDTLGATHGLIGKNTATGNQRGYRLIKTAADVLQAQVSSNGTATTTVSTTGSVTAEQWYFAAMTYFPSASLNVFLGTSSGLEKATNTSSIPAAIFDNTSAFELGRTDSGNYLNGRASLCWLAQTALLDEHIQVLFALTKSLFNI